MLIAQALGEYVALSAVIDAFNDGTTRLEELAGQWQRRGLIALVVAAVHLENHYLVVPLLNTRSLRALAIGVVGPPARRARGHAGLAIVPRDQPPAPRSLRLATAWSLGAAPRPVAISCRFCPNASVCRSSVRATAATPRAQRSHASTATFFRIPANRHRPAGRERLPPTRADRGDVREPDDNRGRAPQPRGGGGAGRRQRGLVQRSALRDTKHSRSRRRRRSYRISSAESLGTET